LQLQENATDDDSSCLQLGRLWNCGGAGIAEGSCGCDGTFPEDGYDCDGNCLIDSDGDGICDAFEIPGCTVSVACNYNAEATDEDGSCVYATPGTNCGGDCIADHDGDGICNEYELAGCTSSSALNYNSQATDDDGSCEWPEGLFTGLSYELVGHDLIEGTSTYRLYANFNADTIIQVTAAYGTQEDNWSISSTEPFYQDENGNLLAQSINPDFFTFFPTVEYDSWLALGGGPGSPLPCKQWALKPSLPTLKKQVQMFGEHSCRSEFVLHPWKHGKPSFFCRAMDRCSWDNSQLPVLFQSLTTCNSGMKPNHLTMRPI